MPPKTGVGQYQVILQVCKLADSTLGKQQKKQFPRVADLPNWDDLYPLLIEGGISGFNVQLTGSHNGAYGRRGQTSSFWSSDEWWFTNLIPISENPWRLSVRAPNYINIGHGADSDYGFNVRCIKDE